MKLTIVLRGSMKIIVIIKELFHVSRPISFKDRLKHVVLELVRILDTLVFLCSGTMITSQMYGKLLFSDWMEEEE